MDKSPVCRVELKVIGGAASTQNGAGRDAPQVLYVLLTIPGVTLTLISLTTYPPLDRRLPMGLMLSVFLLPAGLQILSFVFGILSERTIWRSLYIAGAFALVLLGVLVFLNGGLDSSVATEVHARIVGKTVFKGRRTQYDLSVSSWRPGKDVEHFQLTSDQFRRAIVGGTANIDIHQGFFGMPWYKQISLESSR